MAAKKPETKNVRGAALVGVNVIPTNVYRGIIRITTKTENRSATEAKSYEEIDEKDVLVNATPSTVNAAFDAVIAELGKKYANPDMVTIKLIEYRDLSTDNLCFSVI